jgi:hypothetical protein
MSVGVMKDYKRRDLQVYLQQIKKKAEAESKNCH